MSWFVYALICLLGWGFADLFYKQSSAEGDGYSHLKLAVWVGLVMGAGAFAFLPFTESIKGGGIAAFVKNAVYYLPASVGYIVSMVIGYAGLRYLELSIVSPVQNASGALSAICMLVFFAFKGTLADEISVIDAGASLLIVAGVIILAFAERDEAIVEDKKYSIGAKALIFPLLYCLFDTLGTAADGIILDEEAGLGLGEFDVLVIYGFTFMLAGLGAWIYMYTKSKKAYNPFKKSELPLLLASLCEEFGQVFYVFAMAAYPVVAAPLVASYCIVSVVLSRLILKEKLTRIKYVCVLLVIAGIVLLGLSEGFSYLA